MPPKKKRKQLKSELKQANDQLEDQNARLIAAETWLREANEQLKAEILQRKIIEGRIKQERDTTQMYLDLAGTLFVAIDTSGTVTLANCKCAEILEYPKEEIVGKNWFEHFIPERLRDQVIPISKQLLAGEIEPAEYFENPVLTRSGTERLIAWHNTILKDKDGTICGHISSGTDITERNAMEEKLRESERKYRLLFDKMTNGYALHRIITDKDGTPVDYEFIEVNAAFEEMTGLRNSDVAGKRVREILPGIEKSPADWIGRYGKVALLGKDQTFEEYSEPLGQWYSVLAFSPEKGYFATIFKNITDRKLAEQQLKESEKQYRNLYETMEQGVVYQDAEGRITSANPAAERILGLTTDQLRSRTSMNPEWKALDENGNDLPGDNHPPMLALKTGRTIKDFLMRIYNPVKDKHVFILVNATPRFNDGQKHPCGVYSTFLDITDRKRLEEEQRKVNKLESVGLLAGGIAHDFNNILQTIMGNLQMAQLKKEDRYFRGMELSIERAASLADQLLTFAKGGLPVRETASLDTLVRETTDFVLEGSNVRPAYTTADGLWNGDIDPNQISQVIHNLVENAKQSMPRGGLIELFLDNVSLEQKNTGNGEPTPGRYVRVRVTDHGIGIPEDHLDSIFDPYFTTKTKGSGLGLSICYSIVRKHGGAITAESEPGKGSTFTILLPASEEETDPLPEKDTGCAPPESATSAPCKILIMDDEPQIREIASVILEELGYRTECAADGNEAVSLFKKAWKKDAPFDAVILDLTIPGGMGGTETLKKLVKIDPEVIAVVSSGYSSDTVISDYKKHGFTAALVKPYTLKKLTTVLNNVFLTKN